MKNLKTLVVSPAIGYSSIDLLFDKREALQTIEELDIAMKVSEAHVDIY